MRGYKDLRQYRSSMARRAIPKKTNLNTEGEGASNIIFEMHKLAKQAETYQRERTRLTNQLRDNTAFLKVLKRRFEILKEELKIAPDLFLQEKNGDQKKANKSSFWAAKEAKTKKELSSLNKFFEFDLEY